MIHIAENPQRHRGRVVDNGHCVRFVQVAAGAPHTANWQRGERVRGGSIAPGTVIATFGSNGRYENDTTGRSHAAIFLAETERGLRVLDQWQGRSVDERLISFRGGDGPAVNDGDAFYVVTTA